MAAPAGEALCRVETHLMDLHLGEIQEPAMQAQGKVTKVDSTTNQNSWDSITSTPWEPHREREK